MAGSTELTDIEQPGRTVGGQIDQRRGAIGRRREASRGVLEAFATGDFDVYDEVIAPGFIDHDPQNPYAADRRGPQLMRATAILYRSAFPDLVVAVEDQYEAGDVVISRWTAGGTQTGEFPGLPPTGRHAITAGVQIDRFEGDKIVEGWRYWDTLGMLQQLGAVPIARALTG